MPAPTPDEPHEPSVKTVVAVTGMEYLTRQHSLSGVW